MTIYSKYPSIPWSKEGISFVPITEFPFTDKNINLTDKLDHGFEDLKKLFPSWQGFLNRSLGNNSDYPKYMTYLLCRSKDQNIIGVLAVQLLDFDNLFKKNKAAHPKIKDYLYLSWIGVDRRFRSLNYFSLLFEYYYSLVRQFRKHYDIKFQGAAIIIRRMRQYLWSLFNEDEICPDYTGNVIVKDSPRFTISFMPSETINKEIDVEQDHILILFKRRT